MASDDGWGDSGARLELPDEALAGLADFSQAEVVFVFDKVPDDGIVVSARRPRDNSGWPFVGMRPTARRWSTSSPC